MRFFGILTALVATITPILAATVPLEGRSHAPCHAHQEGEQRCGSRGSNRIELCVAAYNAYYWGNYEYCSAAEYCHTIAPGTCVCMVSNNPPHT